MKTKIYKNKKSLVALFVCVVAILTVLLLNPLGLKVRATFSA